MHSSEIDRLSRFPNLMSSPLPAGKFSAPFQNISFLLSVMCKHLRGLLHFFASRWGKRKRKIAIVPPHTQGFPLSMRKTFFSPQFRNIFFSLALLSFSAPSFPTGDWLIIFLRIYYFPDFSLFFLKEKILRRLSLADVGRFSALSPLGLLDCPVLFPDAFVA